MVKDMEELIQLQERFTHLEKHLFEQDAEMHQINRRIDRLTKKMRELEMRFKSSEEGSDGDLPVNEKPPHY